MYLNVQDNLQLEQIPVVIERPKEDPKVLKDLAKGRKTRIHKNDTKEKRKEFKAIKEHYEWLGMEINKESRMISGTRRLQNGSTITARFFYETAPEDEELDRKRSDFLKNGDRIEPYPMKELAHQEMALYHAPRRAKEEKLRVLINFFKEHWEEETFYIFAEKTKGFEPIELMAGGDQSIILEKLPKYFGKFPKDDSLKKEKTLCFCIAKAAEERGLDLHKIKVSQGPTITRFPAYRFFRR